MPYIGNTIRAADDYRLIDDISSGFNGSTTSFALQVAGSAPVPFPKSPQQVLISVNGVIQEPDPTGSSGFNLVGTNIVFSSAPTNGHAFFGIIYATADYLNAGGNFPAGSLGAPSITFIGDENTGLFRKSGGSVGFVSDATEIANFDSNGITISSGNLIIPDSIIHNGDTDTKIRFSGADQVKIQTAGTERAHIDGVEVVFNDTGVNTDFRIEGDTDANLFKVDAGNNRIGIGTASPSRKLDVIGDAEFLHDNGIVIEATSTNTPGQLTIIGVNNSNQVSAISRIKSVSTDSSSAATATTFSNRNSSNAVNEHMRIDSAGRVLIGTTSTSPANSYSDNLIVSEAGDVGMQFIGNQSNSNYASLYFGDPGANSRAFLEAQLGDNGNFTIGAAGTGPMRFNNNGSERMRIDSSGRMLIGTTSPIMNEAGFNEIVIGGKSEGAAINLQDADSNVKGGLFTSDVNNAMIVRTITNHPLNFRTNNTERMRIDSSGNVGISNSDPKAQLHVNSDKNAGTDKHDASNYHLVLRNPQDDSGEECGLGFSVTSNATKIGAAIMHERDGGGSEGSLQFYTNGDGNSVTERVRITAGGDIDIADAIGQAISSKVAIQHSGINPRGLFVLSSHASFQSITMQSAASRNTTNGSYRHFQCSINGVADKMRVMDSGNVTNTNNSYGSLSDERLKENIVDASSQWDDIKALRIRKFNFKSLTDPDQKTMLGVVAQEAELVCPGLVTSEVSMQEGVEQEYKSFKYSVLYMKAIKCLQEAQAKIETLETKVAALEAA